MASRTLEGPLGWQGSTLPRGDAVRAVAGLERENGDALHVIGSTDLARQPMSRDLVDELHVVVDPVVLGGGKGVVPDDGVLRPLRLVDSQVTSTGAHIATFATAEG